MHETRNEAEAEAPQSLFREHPTLVITLLFGAQTWLSLVYESAFLQSFGVVAAEYASIEDFFMIGFRRPNALLWFLIVTAVVVVASELSSSYATRKNPSDKPKVRIITASILAFVILLLTFFATIDSARYRAQSIQALTPATFASTKLLSLSSVRVTFGKEGEALSPTETFVQVSRLGDSLVLYALQGKHTIVVSKSQIQYIEIPQHT